MILHGWTNIAILEALKNGNLNERLSQYDTISSVGIAM